MENGLDTTHFLSGSFYDASFDAQLGGGGSGLTPVELPTTSASPPSNQISLLPNDSGIELGMDDQQGQRRSSSEEKDSLTPAQSRRKAQNRAA